MPISKEKLKLIKTILEDDTIMVEEEALHMLLQERISKDALSDSDKNMTLGQKAADKLAKFAGSWGFIIIFFLVLLTWIAINVFVLPRPYDAYPFILLNLILSCLAAIQAPVIMMSQNRQEEKDRLRAKSDYKVNLKSEIIVVDIHEKLDVLIKNQQSIVKRLIRLEKENEEQEDQAEQEEKY